MEFKYDNSDCSNWAFDTRAVHAGQPIDSEYGSRAMPLHMTTAFAFEDCQDGHDRFELKRGGHIYTRLNNPTNDMLEERLASLEGGVASVMFSSGMAAILATVETIAAAGDEIVSSPRLYGGTETLFRHTLPKMGLNVIYVEDPDDPASWEAAITPKTKMLYGETISNPANDVMDIPAIAEVAHRNQLPLVIDNTMATPYITRPLEMGANIVVESATKYLGGHGTAMAGAVIDGGNFDWTVERDGEPIFPGLSRPEPAYHGFVFSEAGPAAFALKVRTCFMRDTGGAISPFNAWLIAQGLETLALRMDRHVENAQIVAEWLEKQDLVEHVNFAGLPSSPWYENHKKICPKGPGAVVAFDVKGSTKEAWAFIDALKLHTNLTNLGDTRSLVNHSGSTTHSQLSDEAKKRAGITDATVRLSLGIENVEDIIADLERGFEALRALK
ncbi:MAG TPA: aminotransferase class I/II-fold pyridoxal phosphate-dependent enzyme [Corynebacteriales bacterium]|nr:aminotransferase class I/II-fold pyridoxal phosphate-dependent enzyme [Mycobacteriales bacterium]